MDDRIFKGDLSLSEEVQSYVDGERELSAEAANRMLRRSLVHIGELERVVLNLIRLSECLKGENERQAKLVKELTEEVLALQDLIHVITPKMSK